MKKLLLLSVLLVLMTGFASTMWATMLNESFEGATFPPYGWAVDNINNTTWDLFPDPVYCHTGDQAMKSGYSFGDWWIMTPQLTPVAGANTLSLWYRDYSDADNWDYTDEYTYVMVSTAGNTIFDFVTTVWTGDWATFTMDYQQASIDLSAYDGMNIYVAFKSYHSGGNYRLIDDVTGINFAVATAAPLATTLTSPALDAIGASLSTSLNWNAAAGIPDGYRVYFDTVNPPVAMVSDQTGTSWNSPAALAANTEYWWQIVPYNTFGDAAACQVWHFTTGSGLGFNMCNGSYTVPAGSYVNFFDSGGLDAGYQDDENFVFTFYPQAGHYIKANFSAFYTEGGYDYLYIYDGIDTSAPLIGSYNDYNGLLGYVTATGPMTFAYYSDGSATFPGWEALIFDMDGAADVPAGIDTPVNGITVNSTIDLTIDATVTLTDPILLALPAFNPIGSTVMAFNGVGLGNLTVSVPAGTWYVGLYAGNWYFAIPYPFVGPGTYTFYNINYGAKADAILLLTPGDPLTLPVELSSFTAVLTAEYFVNLTWVTESETQVLGFNVYRSDDDDVANAVRINASAIEATNTSEQHTYSVLDREVATAATYYYWLENVDMGGGNALHGPQMVTVTGNPTPVLPEISMLQSAYPNPFRSGTTANFNVSIKAGETGTVTVYNILGQTVKTFKVNQGSHILKWDGKDCGSGVYFYRLTTPTLSSTKKLVIIK